MSVSGARNDTIMNNTFANNGAWGVILVPYTDSGAPCTGGTRGTAFGDCLFDEWGDAIIGNTFVHDGFFGHPSNGEFAQVNLENGHPTDCYRGNKNPAGLGADAKAAEKAHPYCNGTPTSASQTNLQFLTEVLCDAQISLTSGPPSCPSGQYPRQTRVVIHPLPDGLKSMPNPCVGVPANPWCPARKSRRHASRA
jgi:hypothetical protein